MCNVGLVECVQRVKGGCLRQRPWKALIHVTSTGQSFSANTSSTGMLPQNREKIADWWHTTHTQTHSSQPQTQVWCIRTWHLNQQTMKVQHRMGQHHISQRTCKTAKLATYHTLLNTAYTNTHICCLLKSLCPKWRLAKQYSHTGNGNMEDERGFPVHFSHS